MAMTKRSLQFLFTVAYLSLLVLQCVSLGWYDSHLWDARVGLGLYQGVIALLSGFILYHAVKRESVPKVVAILTLVGAMCAAAAPMLLLTQIELAYAAPAVGFLAQEVIAAGLLIGVLPIVVYEISLLRAPMESKRNEQALLRGLAVSFLFIFVASALYSLTQRSVSADFTSKREPSPATRRLAGSLDRPLEVVMFFPPLSNVGDAVGRYFANLKRGAPSVSVERVDPALEPRQARAFGLTADGAIGLRIGERRVLLPVPLEGAEARAMVRHLDREVYRRIAGLTESPRAVYFTAGHGEPPLDGPRATEKTLQSYLQALRFEVRPLSAAEGLTQQVPADAAAVFIVGPRRAFLKSELAALSAYVAHGGRIFISVDPDTEVDALLAPLGVQVTDGVVTQERGTVSLSARPSLADRQTFLVRGEEQTALGPLDAQMLFTGARALVPRLARGVLTTALVYSNPSAWTDQDRDYLFTEAKEAPRGRQTLAVAVEGPGAARGIIIGDADFIADKALAYASGNDVFVAAALRWLFDESDKGAMQLSETDRPILRRRGLERAGALVLPLAFLLVGIFMGRKKGRP